MKNKKLTLYICNIIISVLCIVAIASYFIAPLWKVDVSYTITADMMKELMGDVMGSEGGDGNEDNNEPKSAKGINAVVAPYATSNDEDNDSGSSGGFNLEDIDFTDIVGEDGITIHIGISLDTSDIMDSLGENPEKAVESIITKNVDGIVNDLEPTLDHVADKLVDFAANTASKVLVDSMISGVLEDAGSDKSVDEIFAEAGIEDKDEYVEEKTQKVIDAIKAGDKSSKEVAAEITTVIEEVYNDFKDIEEFEGEELTDEDKAEIEEEIADMLKEFENENGEINIDAFMDKLLSSAMGTTGGSENSGIEDDEEVEPKSVGAVTAGAFGVVYATAPDADEEEAEDIASDLKTMLRDTIMEAFPEEVIESFVQVLNVIAYIIIFTFVTWAYPILKILVKLAAKNPGIKLKVPIWLGCIPFVVLMGIPTLAIKVLFNPDMISSMAGAEAAETVSTMLGGLEISFFSSSVVSFGIAVFFVLFGLFFYGRVRRKLKKEIKAEKKARRLAAREMAYQAETEVEDEE